MLTVNSKLKKIGPFLMSALFYGDIFLVSKILGFDEIVSGLITIFLPLLVYIFCLFIIDYDINIETIKNWNLRGVWFINLILFIIFMLSLANLYGWSNRRSKGKNLTENYG